VCVTENKQNVPKLVSDGAGGAIIIWVERVGAISELRAQRIDPDGANQWAVNGIVICAVSRSMNDTELIADEAGGAIITWVDERVYRDYNIYAQRIDADGSVQWMADGIPVCTAALLQTDPQVVRDGYGGVVITWADNRADTNSTNQYDIYAQRVNGSGVVQWTADGVAVCDAQGFQSHPYAAPSDDGGAYIAWNDFQVDDIFGQKLSAFGEPYWTANGIPMCNAAESQSNVRIVEDEVGTAYIVWHDVRNGNYDIYAQRVHLNGSGRWAADGIAVCELPDNQWFPEIITDCAGGAIVSWRDYRNGNPGDIYAQRLAPDGTFLWEAGGVGVCTAPAQQSYPSLACDLDGGAIFAWQDTRNAYYNLFAQRIDGDGYWGYPPPAISGVQDIPGDQGGFIVLSWLAGDADELQQIVTHFTIWRDADPAVAASLYGRGLRDGVGPSSRIFAGQPAFRRERTGMKTFSWVLVDSLDAYHFASYSKVIPTLYDTTASVQRYHYFQVMAHTSDPSVYWISYPDSGASGDNLAPLAPKGLTGDCQGEQESLTISWSPNRESDLSYYAVYRDVRVDFSPSGENRIATTRECDYTDHQWNRSAGYYYKVAAVDIHDNESAASLLKLDDSSDGDTGETSRIPYLAQNVPNPFNPVTRITYRITEGTDVSLSVYDASGRLVKVLVAKHLEADHYTVSWDGKDEAGRPVASGIYFYRLAAEMFTETRKMVLIR
jgi:hypothetical protein